jgi:hypothetical protein
MFKKVIAVFSEEPIKYTLDKMQNVLLSKQMVQWTLNR